MILYTKEGKKLPFPDFLVHSEEHLEPNEVSIMELSCKNRYLFLQKNSIMDVDWVLNTYMILLLHFLPYMVCCNFFGLLHGPKIISYLLTVLILCYYPLFFYSLADIMY